MSQPIYDCIIVGSGAAGGMAAQKLCAAGLRVLMLEAGRSVDYLGKENYHHKMPWEFQHRGFLTPEEKKRYSYVANAYNKHVLADEKQNPYTTPPGKPFVWVRSRCVGGKTLHWGRMSFRWSDLDFKAASRDGYGVDWPISYKDLEPYYEYVERLVGISGTREGIWHLPDGIFLPPVPLRCGETELKKGCERLGLKLIPTRIAVTTKDYGGRPKCHFCGYCDHLCDSGSMFTSPTVFLPAAAKSGNFTLRPNSIVREVLLDENARAKGVAFIDGITHQSREAYAKVVVLAASTFESTRLMLNSRSRFFPNGLANSSGQVGRNLCEHVMAASITGFVPKLKGKRATYPEDGNPGGTYVPRFRNVTDRHPKFIRGYSFECDSGAAMFPGYASDLPGFGSEWKREIKRIGPGIVSMGTNGEVLTSEKNFVEIDPVVKDAWGIPVLKIHMEYGPNENAMVEDMAEKAQEIFTRAGVEILSFQKNPLTPGWSIHEMGTARMGNDPRTSVLNPFGQTHDVKNLFVVDGSQMVSASCLEPTITIMALAARGCDYLVEEFKRGRL
jgi:glucoside 3-dehydrogenase (cytochrome c) catalytic subunit